MHVFNLKIRKGDLCLGCGIIIKRFLILYVTIFFYKLRDNNN